jgi:hypothetical protein
LSAARRFGSALSLARELLAVHDLAAWCGAYIVAASEGGVAYIWCGRGQTDVEACERHYQCRPGDRKASQTYIIGWIEDE